MPVDEWPALDRHAWDAATQGGGLLDDSGLAARWRPQTQRWLVAGYGRYLTFLKLGGWLDLKADPAQRMTKEWLGAYIEELQGQIAPKTLQQRLTALCEAMRVMAPTASFPYLRTAKARQKARARPVRDKAARLVPAGKLFALGLKLMEIGDSGACWRDIGNAIAYRDGLMLALLSCRPVRRRNFAELAIGKSFVRQDDAYVIDIPGTETKNHCPYRTVLDPSLTSYIEKYLSIYRPSLLAQMSTNSLWVSWGGEPLCDGTLYSVVMNRTKAEFGCGLSPHLFRDCAATTLGDEKPEYVWLGMRLLGHNDPRTTEKHYDQALSRNAIRKYQNVLINQRKKIA